MEYPRSDEPVSAHWVVLLLSRDAEFGEELAIELASREPGVELHTTRSTTVFLDHLRRVRPDAVVVDTAQLVDAQRLALCEGWRRINIPTVLISSDTAGAHCWLGPDAGAVEVIARQRGFVAKVHHSVLDGISLAREDNRVQETEHHYRDILDSSTDGIFVTVQGKLTYANTAFAHACGHSSRELVGKEFTSLIAPHERSIIEEDLARMAVGNSARLLLEFDLADGNNAARHFEVACKSSVVNGQRAIVGVARDVTELTALQIEIQRARERTTDHDRLRALGEVAAGVAHDFNNALETILGRVAIAKDKALRHEPHDADLAVIEEAAQDAAYTVKRIQSSTRPDCSDWQDLNLTDMLREAIELIRTRVPSHVELALELLPVPLVRGSSAELREVMQNLLANAIDAISTAGTIHVRCYAMHGQPVIEVEDDGCGMSHEVQRRIFEPFFTTKGEGGNGIGLSVSRGILRRHDVEIQLKSAPGEGTLFRLMFPAPALPAQIVGHLVPAGSLSVIVLDDEPAVAELLQDLLKELGHRVQTATEPKALLSLAAEPHVQLVLTDLDQPGVSGWQVARSVRQVRPDILVGLLTGWPLAATTEELRARGVDFVLAKPFSLEQLRDTLSRFRAP